MKQKEDYIWDYRDLGAAALNKINFLHFDWLPTLGTQDPTDVTPVAHIFIFKKCLSSKARIYLTASWPKELFRNDSIDKLRIILVDEI